LVINAWLEEPLIESDAWQELAIVIRITVNPIALRDNIDQ
jgi:hypothetical protein